MTTKEYREAHKEQIKIYNARYKGEHQRYFKEYSVSNRDSINAKRRERRANDPIKYRARTNEYYANHIEQARAKDARYRAKIRVPYTYICRDIGGKVIYVGRGIFNKRIAHHKVKSSWWSEVANIKKRKCLTWGDSLVLEALLIRKYQPKYNREGVSI